MRGNQQAFPTPPVYSAGEAILQDTAEFGMSIRTYAAVQIMAGVVGNGSWNQTALEMAGVPEHEAMAVAGRLAVAYADALIAALNAEKT